MCATRMCVRVCLCFIYIYAGRRMGGKKNKIGQRTNKEAICVFFCIKYSKIHGRIEMKKKITNGEREGEIVGGSHYIFNEHAA